MERLEKVFWGEISDTTMWENKKRRRVGKLNLGRANDLSLIKHHLYKHLFLYIDFVSFNKQSRNCYLKDTASFFQHCPVLAANSCNVFIILKL